ncbi:MAG: hypothetical protein LAT79_18325 [Kiritimatiellae bacterium]|nr:hypothetical protein [Kiritimatiellia bacterium]
MAVFPPSLPGIPRLLRGVPAVRPGRTPYRLLEREDFPSWLFPVTQGATTIWER